ncbi:transcriptional regulator TetR family [Vibrio astriarenae]|nr:transcriptional regulator TetR family [Vibrio sp. C7]
MSRKQKVIETAARLFSEKGYEKTPISLICEEAHVSKGTVFHHFKNKDEVLRAVFLHITDIIEEADRQDDDVQDENTVLQAMIESIFDGMTVNEHRKMYQLIST